MLRASLALLLLAAPPVQDDAAVKKAVDDFKAKAKETKSLPERAKLVLDFAEQQPRDKVCAKALGSFLAPTPQDLNYLVPIAAADALGRFRGNATAAQVLAGALPAAKKTPFLHTRMLMALGRIGHEQSFLVFD